MNIILVVADTMRYDYAGFNGNLGISTPNLDRLAKESTVFDRAYLTSFPTVPLRADLLSGRFTSSYFDYGNMGFFAQEQTLAETLGKNNYVSMMIYFMS